MPRVPVLCAVVLAALGLPAAAHAVPILPGLPSTLPESTGAPATAEPAPRPAGPQNPYMARNPNSNIHNDTWMTDAYARSGPLGRNLVASSIAMPPSVCGSLTFDSRGRIITVCPSTFAAPQLRVVDRATQAVLGTYDMPQAENPPGTKAYQNFTGGGYFFLDQRDRVWAATKTNRLFVLRISADGRTVTKDADYDLTPYLADDQRITSALPDFKGRIWFVSKRGGVIGVLDTKTGKARTMTLGEEVQNSFSVDRDGVYIVSDKRLYRFWTDRAGRPAVQWKSTYRNSGIVKPSQVNAGSGTTPTNLPGGFVAITDNADPMNVVVYRSATRLAKGQRRVVCQVPVFKKGASATENSLMGVGRSLVVENNYGYEDPFGPKAGAISQAGFARIDIAKDGRSCRKVWETYEAAAPSLVPKLSSATGLIYVYLQEADPVAGTRWSWAGISFRTGKVRWKQLAGTGALFNNNYAGVAIDPDGALWLGTFGGLVTLRDGGGA